MTFEKLQDKWKPTGLLSKCKDSDQEEQLSKYLEKIANLIKTDIKSTNAVYSVEFRRYIFPGIVKLYNEFGDVDVDDFCSFLQNFEFPKSDLICCSLGIEEMSEIISAYKKQKVEVA